ncbi:DUF885 family protein [Sphingomonas changnyeongensis]|uniref:DUF885 family protein n=1 Tax=Sphingomonas changnyeongensis TaxID=2698679 RepID=A0A7Z2S6K3_9SPHN|nr:DUF885 family protein [Sphingomonas changnyeongensis]QHL91603.1 DUF885 family protein [Sphingomonas changnyeongensis]
MAALRFKLRHALALALAVTGAVSLPAPVLAATAVADQAGPPAGQGSYGDLLALWSDFLAWRDAPAASQDFSAAAVAARRTAIAGYLRRMEDMNVASWDRSRRADWLAARSKMDEVNFLLNVSKPWERDPGFYVDQMLEVTFTTLPVKGEALARLQADLRAIPLLVARAKTQLRDIPGDYADLALHNLSNADGVGHGHPYRKVPPAGVIGWYDDLEARARTAQPALLKDIRAARAAALDMKAWLTAGRPQMTALAGVGKANFDWYLKNVKLLPYTADQLMVLGDRETKRLWSIHALEEHRNRKLPRLTLPQSEAEYEARRAETDKRIRAFLTGEEIITIPSDIGELYVNVPWIVRPKGPNFWEQVQYRDPSPDWLHATIPGHAFDGQMAKRDTHPIRGRISDGVRAEGWAVYLEEGAQRLGLFEDTPRVRELIDIFGIFRAVRIAGDVKLQLNQAKVADIVREWQAWTPWLDPDVARVDAEIYLRRPPGYGLGYTVGMIEMQKLLADVRHQQGDAFVLRDFHDRIMTIGRIPMSLIRYDMTGYDDEVRQFWRRDPLPGS